MLEKIGPAKRQLVGMADPLYTLTWWKKDTVPRVLRHKSVEEVAIMSKRFSSKDLWRTLTLLGALALALLVASPATGQQANEVMLYEETFDDGEAQGWQLAQTERGIWVVEGDMLYGQGTAGAYYAKGEWVDLRLTLEVVLLDNAGAVRIGVRHGEAGRYTLTLYPGRAELARQGAFGGDDPGDLLAEPRVIKLALEEPHAVELVASGGRLSASIDGRTIFDVKDPQRPLPAGFVSLESLAKGSIFVDNLRVYGLKESTPTGVLPIQLPDLVVLPVEAWGYEKECTAIGFAVTIANHGAAKSPPTSLVVADVNAKWELGAFEVEALPADGAQTLEILVPVPSNQRDRDHEIAFIVDPGSDIEESTKNNNLTVLRAPACELGASMPTPTSSFSRLRPTLTPVAPELPVRPAIRGVEPAVGRCDSEIEMRVLGQGFTPETRLTIPDGVQVLWTEFIGPSELLVGLFIEPDAPEGPRAIEIGAGGAVLGPARVIFAVECPRQPEGEPQPDLVIGRISHEVDVEGWQIILSVLVANGGDAPSPGSILRAEADAMEEEIDIDELGPGQRLSLEVVMGVPEEAWGRPHEIRVMLDPYEDIQEVREDNNAGSVVVALPDLPEEDVPDVPEGNGAEFPVGAAAAAGVIVVGGGALLIRRLARGRAGRGGEEPPDEPQQGRPPGFPPLRLARVWLSEGVSGSGRVLSDREAMASGSAYTLHLQVPDAGGKGDSSGSITPLDVVLFSPESEFEMDRRAETLRVPQRGDSNEVRCVITPKGAGQRRVRACIYRDNVLLQSVMIEADALSGEGSAGAISRQTDYVARLDLTELEALPRPALNIFTNQGAAGTHWVGVHSSHDAARRELRAGVLETFGESVLEARAEALRSLWFSVEATDGRSYRQHASDPAKLAEYVARLERDLLLLAQLGRRTYHLLFSVMAESWGDVDEMEKVLAEPNIISVARCRGASVTIPWAALYAYDINADDILSSGRLCEIFKAQLADNRWSAKLAKLEEKHDLLDDPVRCRSQAGCPLEAGDRLVVCPFGFWGFKHQVEQPLQQVVPTSVERAPDELSNESFNQTSRVAKAAGEPAELAFSVFTGLPGVQEHRAEFGAMAQSGILQLAYADVKAEVLALLQRGDQHLYYFYCHGEEDNQKTFQLKVGASGSPGVIGITELQREWQDDWSRPPRPLVVLNACDSIALVPEKIQGFLEMFRKLGATGVIGTEITVWTDLAQPFGLGVVRAFLGGQSIGEAFLDARRDLLRRFNPLGLVYTYHAPATLHLHDPDGCAWCRSHGG